MGLYGDGRFKARLVALGWRQRHGIDCGNRFALVFRFDLLVIASATRVNIPDVQNILLSWILLHKNELKSTIIHFSKLYRVKEHSCS